MKLLTLLMSSLLAISGGYAENMMDFDTRHNKPEEHKHDSTAFGSFVTETNQTFTIIGQSDIAFETTLDSKNIKQAINQSTFTIEVPGSYLIQYGVSISTDNSSVFSIHKNGSSVAGTSLGVASINAELSSQTVILKLRSGDTISLSADAVPVTITTGVTQTTVAYINFEKVD